MILLAVCSALTLSAQESLILHYDFRDVQGRTVVDKSASHFDGKLCGSAVADTEGINQSSKIPLLTVLDCPDKVLCGSISLLP